VEEKSALPPSGKLSVDISSILEGNGGLSSLDAQITISSSFDNISCFQPPFLGMKSRFTGLVPKVSSVFDRIQCVSITGQDDRVKTVFSLV
jgi:hypothetical protein